MFSRSILFLSIMMLQLSNCGGEHVPKSGENYLLPPANVVQWESSVFTGVCLFTPGEGIPAKVGTPYPR